MSKPPNSNTGVVTRSRSNMNGEENVNNEGQENETNDTPEVHANNIQNEPNEMNVDTSNVNANTLLCTLLSQNAMLMELLKSQQDRKSSNDMTIAPDLNKSIPIFNGLTTGAQAQDWLRTVNGVANLHHWPDNFKLQSVRANLDGAARHWFISRDIEDWADFERQFRKTFVGVVLTGDCWKEMSRRVQLRNENVREYFHEKVYLCKRVGLSFYESKIQVLEGLYSKDLSMYLLGRDHRDEDDLLSDMVEYERLDISRATRFRQPSVNMKENGVQKPTPRQQNDAPQSLPTKKESTKTTTDYEGKPTVRSCYNCGSRTHISPQCPKPKREKGACYECGSTSHQIGSCPGRTKQSSDASTGKQPGLMNIDVADDDVPPVDYPKPYEVQCDIDVPVAEHESCEVKFNAVIDTGSPISLLKCEFIPNNYAVIKPASDSNFYGINGAKLNILGIFETNVTINNNVIDFKFYIVPNNTMSSDAILGRDLLSKPGFKIEFVNDNVNITDLNSDMIMKKVNNNFDEILCINYGQDENDRNNCLLNINPDLDTEIRNKFIDVYNNEYHNMLKGNVESHDGNVDFDTKIILKHEQPISFRPRRLSYSEQNKLRVILDELLSEGVIRPSNSAYSSPVVLVKKKSGDYRLCIDYRELNKITVRDNFPTPLIDDQLDRLRDKRIFTLLDLRNGFHHVRMCEKSIPYTSFVTPLGQYEYVKMPFGLTNSPRVFGRFIQFVFHELIRRGDLLVYLNDMMIATQNYTEHFAILKEVFRLAAKHNLQFRLDKCFFGFKEVEYLGYLINEHGVRPSSRHIEAMLTYPIPKNQKQVRQFLGLASYFRRFIPNFSTVAKPLYDLVKKNTHFMFGDREQSVFKFLCTTLTESPVLAIYSPDADTELHCDASSSGFGVILLQKHKDNILKPVFYFSQRTSPSESKFHSFELECLAVVYAIKRFHVYLAGITFKVMTDCDSFRLTLSKKEINPRISRWALFLQNYDFNIFHRPNKNMQHVDAFSRCHAILVLESNSFEQVLALRQNTDDDIIKIRDELLTKDSKLFELRNGLVYRKENKNVKFYVPKSMESNVIRTCHDDMAHVGLLKVIENISRVYWFPDMKTKVRDYVNNCLKCIEFTVPSGKKEGFLNYIPKGDKPFLTIHVDHLGPLEKTGNRNKFIFVVIDAFTKFVKLYPCRSTKTEEVIKHLRNYFQTYSKPRKIISDRGTSFTSAAFKHFLEDESVNLVLVAAGTPRANGQVEIVNKSVVPMLAKLSESTNKWDRVLNVVEFAINNTIHRSTGQSPSVLLFGVNQVGIVNDEIRLILDNEINTSCVDLDEVRKIAAECIEKAQEGNAAQYNSKRKTPTIYKENDYVMITNVDVTVGHNKKLIPKFRGPYVVRKVLNHDRYVIGDIDGFQVTQRPFETIVGPDRMKMWIKI